MTLTNRDCPKDLTACLFTGHRELPQGTELDSLQERTKEALRLAYFKGCRQFYVGGAMGFDMLAAIAVLNLREELPGIHLILALPHFGHYQRWNKTDKAVFARILERADRVLYLSKEYCPGCMQARNRYMVDHAQYCICYCGKATGGTAYTVRYARKKGVQIVNLWEKTERTEKIFPKIRFPIDFFGQLW